MWANADPAEVRQAWAEELGRYDGPDLRDALDALRLHYQEFPPTLFQFATLCREAVRRRAQSVAKLDPPRAFDPAGLQCARDLAAKLRRPACDGRDWASRVLEREAAGERMPMISISMARDALGLGE